MYNQNHLGEAILMSINNICAYEELMKSIFQLSSNTLLIWASETGTQSGRLYYYYDITV